MPSDRTPLDDVPTETAAKTIEKSFNPQTGGGTTASESDQHATVPEPTNAPVKVEKRAPVSVADKPRKSAVARPKPTRIDHRGGPKLVTRTILDEKLERIAFAPRSRSSADGYTGWWATGAIGSSTSAIPAVVKAFIGPHAAGLGIGGILQVLLFAGFVVMTIYSLIKPREGMGKTSAELLAEIRAENDQDEISH